MFYVTGDTHARFQHIADFCQEKHTTKEDVLIILGDSGINFSGLPFDEQKKKYLETLPITIFAIHGNHDKRPYTVDGYAQKEWRGGVVYHEEAFPHLLFAKDGEIFDLGGFQAIVMGGAYSIDKQRRLLWGYPWFSDEQPSEEIKQYVEAQLEKVDWKVDVVLSHTTPLKYEPIEIFYSNVDQTKIDKSTEEWLDRIEDKLTYQKWYCGHFHIEKQVDKLQIMFNNIEEFRA